MLQIASGSTWLGLGLGLVLGLPVLRQVPLPPVLRQVPLPPVPPVPAPGLVPGLVPVEHSQ